MDAYILELELSHWEVVLVNVILYSFIRKPIEIWKSTKKKEKTDIFRTSEKNNH